MKIDILSLFPEYFQGPFDTSIIKRAQDKGVVGIGLTDIRDFAEGKHRQVDDRPYGGGPGMVMMPDPICKAIMSVRQTQSRVIYLSPQGQPLTAAKCRELAEHEHLILLCGHYEGVDQRVLDREVDEEISIGDYVLTNGCLPAIVLVDAVVRMLPGALGHELGAHEESFEKGLLEGPQYTRPVDFEGMRVPELLLGGDHQKIERWRLTQALERTEKIRPELYIRHMMADSWDLPENRLPVKRRQSTLAQIGVDSVRLVVRKLRTSLDFYRGRLGMNLIAKSSGHAVLDLGNVKLYLIEGQREKMEGLAPVFDLRIDDVDLFDQVSKRALELGGIEYGACLHRDPMRETVTVELCDPDGNYWSMRYKGHIEREKEVDIGVQS